MSVLLRMIVIMVVCTMATGAIAATPDQIEQARASGLAWLISNQKGDGSWRSSSDLGIQATSATLEAMLNAGIKKGYSFGMAEGWLANAEALSTDSLSRQTIALARTGADVTSFVKKLTDNYRNGAKAWGAYPVYGASFPDTSLAMDAIFVSQITYADKSTSLGFITGKQNTDGGWPYTKSDPGTPPSRVIPSAHNLLTLSRYKASGTTVDDTKFTNAVNWLLSARKADGGFADSPGATSGSPYETALAYLALTEAKKITSNAAANSAQAQTVRESVLNFMIAQQKANGSWSDDAFQTALVLQTLPSTVLPDTDKDGIPDAVEAYLGTNSNVTDSRGFAEGNGQGSSFLLAESGDLTRMLAVAGQPFSRALIVSGGTAPFSWTLTSGSLPNGLSMSGSGVISGTPMMLGTFNFSYKVTDSVGRYETAAGQIIVASTKLSVNPQADSYGTVYVSAKSPAHTYTISNADNKSHYLPVLDIFGADSSDFRISNNGCSSKILAPSSSCAVQVIFSPTATGAKTAYLSINTDDITVPNLNVSLNGIGQLPTLSIEKTGTGVGIVTAVSVTATISCGSVCGGTYMTGTQFTLTATPQTASSFGGWSGACSGTGGCSVVMNDNVSVAATFSCLNSKVKIAGKPDRFYTLQAAYDAAVEGDVIQAQALEFAENFNANRPISVTLDGGYTCDYSSNPEKTIIKGMPAINSGTVTMKNFHIQQ